MDELENYDNSKGQFECKYCGTQTAYRSRRTNFLERLRSRLSGKLPFRCHRCHRRFWANVDARDL